MKTIRIQTDMVKEMKSEGYCIYCNKLFSQQEISNHIALHLAEMEKATDGKSAVNYFHIVIEADEMFLHLLVKGDAKMNVIDKYLRDIWLECCGHLSAFGHKNFKVSMTQLVEEVMEPRIKIFHDYDFGSTTRVFLKGLKHYMLNETKKIILLSRNEPLEILCSHCKKKPAAFLCIECIDDNGYAFFCEKCSTLHEDECDAYTDYSQMPVVNSPRMGVCGYEGGQIDIERNGIYRGK